MGTRADMVPLPLPCFDKCQTLGDCGEPRAPSGPGGRRIAQLHALRRSEAARLVSPCRPTGIYVDATEYLCHRCDDLRSALQALGVNPAPSNCRGRRAPVTLLPYFASRGRPGLRGDSILRAFITGIGGSPE